MIDSSPLLCSTYKEKATELRSYYYPIEIDPDTTVEEKLPYMHDWYVRSSQLLVDTGNLKHQDITHIVQTSNVSIRYAKIGT